MILGFKVVYKDKNFIMANIFIKGVTLDGSVTNIKIAGNRFTEIGRDITASLGDVVIDGADKAIVPPFYNAHTHAAMTLLRGYADDMPLFPWLNDYIWPFEAKMTEEDIYIGSRLALLEMIKSGTIFFNDMYWDTHETWRATEEIGLRGCMGMTFTDNLGEKQIEKNFELLKEYKDKSSRIQMAIAPHAVYTVSEKLWIRCAEVAKSEGVLLHFHLSETEKEVNDCIEQYGMTPVRWLDKLGILGDNCIAAHVVHVDQEEMQILKDRGVAIAHNPVSNMKLSSGYFKSKQMDMNGNKVLIGTDGCSSNNNLDMLEETKFAAMIAKCNYGPEVLPVQTLLQWSQTNGPKIFGIDAGEIKVGKLAVALLVDLNNERMVPCYNFTSNWIYATGTEAIDTVICDGRILMQNRKVEGEEEIICRAKSCCRKWM